MLNELGYRAHRLSIEWSRIVPEEGKVSKDEINHYREVLQTLRKNNQLGFVTLHHFTSPIWFMNKGGFEKKDNLVYWEEYVNLVCEHLGEYIDVFNTINEPNVYASLGYFEGIHPPGKKSIRSYLKVSNNLIRAHFIAVDVIHQKYSQKEVGIVKNLVVFRPHHRWNPIDQVVAKIFDWAFNTVPLKALRKKKIPFGIARIKRGDIGEFIGINHYNLMSVGIGSKGLIVPYLSGETKLSSMNWGVYPRLLKKVLIKAHKKTNLPIYITESGIATKDDQWRKEVILEYLQSTIEAMKEGVNVRGYFYWSNLDNFEWAEGYLDGGFGLIGVNFDTFERTIKESAIMLGDISSRLSD
jgi:beta-glucosidase